MKTDTESPGPLAGVRIVDLTTVLMGPYATQILGDMGADVIKVEPPRGDGSRHIGPMRNPGMGALFMHVNRSKRSIALDLKTPGGHAALLRLLNTADVLVYNVRPQAMARLNLSYAQVAAVNPRIIYAGCHGFGQDGPYADRPAYDDLIQGAVGLPALAVRAGAAQPAYVPCTIADRTVALHVVNAVTAALYHRERTGHGQSIGIPMFETMVQFVLGDHLAGLSFEPPLGPSGYQRLLTKGRRPYATRDGYISVVVYTDRHWKDFFALIGQTQAIERDARFTDIGARTHHIDELYELVAQAIATRTTAEWLEALSEIDVPAMPLQSVESLLEDPHLNAVGFFQVAEHPSEGRIRSMAVPGTWSQSPPRPTRPVPRLGEHTVELLREAGFSGAEIDALVAEGAAAAPSFAPSQLRS